MRVLMTAIAICAVGEIVAELFDARRAVYVLKPLTTGLIVLLVAVLPDPVSLFYRNAIALGLLFSLAGDVFLMLPSDRFVAGLASFLIAHLCYIAAFWSAAGPLPVAPAVVLCAWGAFLLARLWATLGALRVPVTLYAAVLLVMGWTAFGRTAAAAGAILFVVSDSVLALERFKHKHRWGQAVVLSTYFAAQFLIASSVSAFR